DNFERVPPRGAGLVDLQLQIAQVLEGALPVEGLIGEVPLRHSTGEDRHPHDLEGLGLTQPTLEVDINPEWKGHQIDKFVGKLRINSPLESTDCQPAP